jgi:hypothetical protein
MLKKYLIIIVLALSVTVAFSQLSSKFEKTKYSKHNVEYLSINDSDFLGILDLTLKFEKECKYYAPSLSYGVRFIFRKVEDRDTMFIKVEGNDNQKFFLELEDLKGFINYENHRFFILCDSLPKQIFKKSGKRVSVNDSKRYEVHEDDRWPIYYFRYYNSQYHYIETVDKCKD